VVRDDGEHRDGAQPVEATDPALLARCGRVLYWRMVVRRSLEQLRSRSARHRTIVALIAAMAVAVVSSCGDDRPPSAVSSPSSSSPTSLRYRTPLVTDVVISRDVMYADPLRLDVYEPAGDTAARRPVLIWVHGGGFADGNKGEGPLVAFPSEFAKLGYVTVSIDYRLLASQQCIAERLLSQECVDAATAATQDAQVAVRWVHANAGTYRIDTDRIAIAGESAGAIAATGVGTRADSLDDRVRAWVSVSGGSNGGEFVDGSDAPGLLMSGTADPWVPYEWSADTAAAMQQAGVAVVLRSLDGEGHVPASYTEFFLDEARDFLYAHLDLAHAAQ
jgi:acetyl esterase/lipase